ncbi:MAG: Cobyric acid synthase [Candidatus Methanogaster sp.]|nr:MAG: Cobyric acid synthase [ANME-2 cluster archaeon]
MSLNSWITKDGGEIGIAQAIQTWAAGIEPTVDINPVLLKPKGDRLSQVIILGRPAYDRAAGDYYESINEAVLSSVGCSWISFFGFVVWKLFRFFLLVIFEFLFIHLHELSGGFMVMFL